MTKDVEERIDADENEEVKVDAPDVYETEELPPIEKKVEKDDDEVAEVEVTRPRVSFLPTFIIIVSALLGLAIGVGLADGRGGAVAISWVKLPGDLFLRILKAVVLPLVFVNIILAVIDMIRAGKASAVGWRTIALYTLTTLLASAEGLVSVLLFQPLFQRQPQEEKEVLKFVQIGCGAPNSTLSVNEPDANGNIGLSCVQSDSVQDFIIDNPNGFITEVSAGGPANDISFSKTLQDGIFRKLISDNIVGEFIKGNFVGILIFAIVFGVASQSLKRQSNILVELLEEVNRIFLKIIDWIIFLTPIAVLSLIAGNIGTRSNLTATFEDIGYLIAATLVAMAFHFFVTYTLLFVVFVRRNPFAYMRFIVPAQVFAFASASSAATLPISLDCVMSTKQVPASVANFVLSMGATLNMDGGGIYFPTAIVFLAVSQGLEDQLNAANYFLIILLSTIGSAGTAPVPSASLVLIITSFNTVFDLQGTPEAFGLILAIDWLMDRFRTTLNVTGDMLMSRIVTATAKVTFEDDVLENEAVENEQL